MKKTAAQPILLLVVLSFLFVLPFVASPFTITMCIRVMYYSFMAIGFSFLARQSGLFSLMIPASFGCSAYSIAILESRSVMYFPFSMLAALAVSLVFAGLIGIMVNRSRGTYFLMLTLVIGQLVWALVLQWVSLTKGTNGITGIERPMWFGVRSDIANQGFYFTILIVFTAVVFVLQQIVQSRYGVMIRGVRDSESRMKMLGYRTGLIKWSAFMISTVPASLAGVFFVYFNGVVNPDSIGLSASTQVLVASIFGGLENFIGAIIGSAGVKTLEIVLSGITQRYLLIIGIMFMLVILFVPEGLIGLARNAWVRTITMKNNVAGHRRTTKNNPKIL